MGLRSRPAARGKKAACPARSPARPSLSISSAPRSTRRTSCAPTTDDLRDPRTRGCKESGGCAATRSPIRDVDNYPGRACALARGCALLPERRRCRSSSRTRSSRRPSGRRSRGPASGRPRSSRSPPRGPPPPRARGARPPPGSPSGAPGSRDRAPPSTRRTPPSGASRGGARTRDRSGSRRRARWRCGATGASAACS